MIRIEEPSAGMVKIYVLPLTALNSITRCDVRTIVIVPEKQQMGPDATDEGRPLGSASTHTYNRALDEPV